MRWPVGTTFTIKSDEEEIWTVDLKSNVEQSIISDTSPFGAFLLNVEQGKRCKFVQRDGVEIEYEIINIDTHGIPLPSVKKEEDFRENITSIYPRQIPKVASARNEVASVLQQSSVLTPYAPVKTHSAFPGDSKDDIQQVESSSPLSEESPIESSFKANTFQITATAR